MAKWTEHQIDQAKAKVREQLAPYQQDPAQRLTIIMDWLTSLQGSASPRDQLYQVVLVVSALVHHRRHQGLSQATLQRLAKLATTLMLSRGVRPGISVSSSLYYDLYLVLGQIYRMQGDHRRSLWQQLLAHHQSHNPTGEARGFHLVTMAQRAQRNGQSGLAWQHLEQAWKEQLHRYDRETATVIKARCFRHFGQTSAARSWLEQQLKRTDLDPATVQELLWEGLVLDLGQTGDATPLVKTIEKQGQHYQAGYTLDGWLWQTCLPTTSYADRFVKITTLRRRKELNVQGTGFHLEVCATLEQLQETDIPVHLRLERLGQCLDQLAHLPSIDSEMLVLAAASRSLSRIKALDFAAFTLAEYRSLSLKLSLGKIDDVLGVMSDLYQRSWFQKRYG